MAHRRPGGLDDLTATPPTEEELLGTYETAFSDLDKSPTKVWMIYNRAEEEVEPLFWLGFGKRPQEELYDLRSDPDYMTNLAEDAEYQQVRSDLNSKIMSVLREQDDPRISESPPRFEQAPFAGPVSDDWFAQRSEKPSWAERQAENRPS